MNTILFICEHGSAKSVVAAAHFNRIARELKLPMHAISRGTDPDPTNHPAAIAGLAADGLQPEADPRRLAAADIANANAVFSFGELPPEFAREGPVVVWNVPPISENYEAARTAIVRHINAALSELS